MTFSLQRHCRVAGSVVIVLGWAFSNLYLMLSGNLLWIVAYAWSVTKIERFIEEATEESEEK